MVRAAKAVCCVIQRAKTTIVGRQARIIDSAIVLIGTIHGSVLCRWSMSMSLMAFRSTDTRFFAWVTFVTRCSTRQILVIILMARPTLSTTKTIFILVLPSRTSSASVCSIIHIFSSYTRGGRSRSRIRIRTEVGTITTPTNATFIIGGTFSIQVLMTPRITLSHFGVNSACFIVAIHPWKAGVGAVLIFTAVVAFADIALGEVALHAVQMAKVKRREK